MTTTAPTDTAPPPAAGLGRLALLSGDYFLRYVDQVRLGFGGDLLKGLIFVALVQGNVGHLDRDRELSQRWSDVDAVPPDELRRPIRILPLADSLRLPRESVRRKMQQLAVEGFVVKMAKGFVAPTAVLSRPGNARALASNAAKLADLIDGVAAMGAAGLGPSAAPFRPQPSQYRLLGRVTSDFCLRCLDEVRMLFDGEVLTGLVFLAILIANHEDTGEGRRPISVQALSGRIGLPRETVRRHVLRLITAGFCAQVGGGAAGGLVVDPQLRDRPGFEAAVQRNEVNVRWLVTQLRRAGALATD